MKFTALGDFEERQQDTAGRGWAQVNAKPDPFGTVGGKRDQNLLTRRRIHGPTFPLDSAAALLVHHG